MKKTWIALAVLASAGTPYAQSSVTLFGVVDTAIAHGRANGAGSANNTQMTSGNYSTSRIGFRGREDLGGGLSALFWLEAAVVSDDGRAGAALTTNNQTAVAASGLNFSRRAVVGLAGPWGEVRLGRDVVPAHLNISGFDPFGNLGVGASVMPSVSSALGAPAATFGLVPAGQGSAGPLVRASNMINYLLPQLNGLYGQASYWLGENPGNGAANEDDGQGGGLRVGYAKGPFNVAAGWQRTTFRATPVATSAGAPSGDLVSWNIGGQWDLGTVRLMGVYGSNTRKSAVEAEGRGWTFGGIVPVGVGEIRAALSQYRIDAGPGADPRARKASLGYVHNLSKRTAIYTSVAHVRNSDGARLALGGASYGAGVTNPRSTGFDVGIRHAF
ncbi:MAG TPA: porin [Ramlibacter sp.]|nr:porin [Ramlibacter sp.]